MSGNQRRSRRNNCLDFSKVGGLSHHLKLLQEIVISPTIHQDLYSHFNIKVPKGFLFHGPPGTGKTLLAAALVNQLKRDGLNVTFFERKGGDILDKWVGESERKLHELFEEASKHRLSIIFFDELDGLAPIRSDRNDQVHCSVVATLLALMDGLIKRPGVIVIGATNRLDHIDPALRRPGRFDRELYFPLPNFLARKEILRVHLDSWTCKPSDDFISHLADLTPGYNGSDLQALVSESFMCGVRRQFPSVNNIEERDFLKARTNIIPSSYKNNSKARKLLPSVKPLLQRQLDKILHQLKIIWPHFLISNYKYIIDYQKYIGRMLLLAEADQQLNIHLIPALLQALEHLSIQSVDALPLIEEQRNAVQQNVPSILLMNHIDFWWDIMDETRKGMLMTTLKDLHPGVPLLIICSCENTLPHELYQFFQGNSTLVVRIENPSREERKEYFEPLFISIIQAFEENNITSNVHLNRKDSGKEERSENSDLKTNTIILKPSKIKHQKKTYRKMRRIRTNILRAVTSDSCLCYTGLTYKQKARVFEAVYKERNSNIFNKNNNSGIEDRSNIGMTTILSEIVKNNPSRKKFQVPFESSFFSEYSSSKCYLDVKLLYQKVLQITNNFSVSKLELLLDAIRAHIHINSNNFQTLLQKVEHFIETYETPKQF